MTCASEPVTERRNLIDCFGGRWQSGSPFSADKQKSTIRDVAFLRCDVPFLRLCDVRFLKRDNICICRVQRVLKKGR